MPPNLRYSLPDDVVIDLGRNLLIRNGSRIRLGGTAARVLQMLIERAPDTVPRADFVETIWQGNVGAGEQGLTREIHHLRDLLQDSSRDPHFIVTVPRQGYKLAFKPEPLATTNSGSTTTAKARIPLFAGATLALVAVVGWLVLQPSAGPSPPLVSSPIVPFVDSPQAERFPAIAPGGRYAAFSFRRESQPAGNAAQWQTRIVSTDDPATPVMNVPGVSARFSPGGDRLLFARYQNGKCELHIAQIKPPSTARKISGCSDAPYTNWDWINEQSVVAFQTDPRSALVRHDLDGSGPTPLIEIEGSFFKPRVSPDGRRVAALTIRPNQGQAISILNLTSSFRIAYHPTPRFPTALDWLDDTTLLVTLPDAGQSGTELRQLSISGQWGPSMTVPIITGNLDYDPESGLLLLEEMGVDIDLGLRTDGADQNEVRVGRVGGWDILPRLSPSGDHLAFVSFERPARHLVLRDNANLAETVLFTEMEGNIWGLDWSPQGDLLFSTGSGQDIASFVFDATQRIITRVKHAQHNLSLFAQDSDHLWLFDSSGAGPSTVTLLERSSGGSATYPLPIDLIYVESFGEGLYYQTKSGDLYSWAPEQGSAKQDVLPRMLPWTIRAGELYFVEAGPGFRLMRRPLGETGADTLFNLESLSPSTRAFPQFDVRGDNFVYETPSRRWHDLHRMTVHFTQ